MFSQLFYVSQFPQSKTTTTILILLLIIIVIIIIIIIIIKIITIIIIIIIILGKQVEIRGSTVSHVATVLRGSVGTTWSTTSFGKQCRGPKYQQQR